MIKPFGVKPSEAKTSKHVPLFDDWIQKLRRKKRQAKGTGKFMTKKPKKVAKS